MDCTIEKDGSTNIKGEIKIDIPLKEKYEGPAILSARPEQLIFSDKGMPGVVQLSTFLGDYIEYEVLLDDGQNLIINEYTKDNSKVYADGTRVNITFDPLRVSLYKKDTEEVISKWESQKLKNLDLTFGSL